MLGGLGGRKDGDLPRAETQALIEYAAKVACMDGARDARGI